MIHLISRKQKSDQHHALITKRDTQQGVSVGQGKLPGIAAGLFSAKKGFLLKLVQIIRKEG